MFGPIKKTLERIIDFYIIGINILRERLVFRSS